MGGKLIGQLADKVISGTELTFDEALSLTSLPDEVVPELAEAAGRVRSSFGGERIDLCAITNARSGLCPEDCRFCSQSAHYECDSAEYPMTSSNDILAAAKKAEAAGAHRFCIVTSGPSLSEEDFETVLEAVAAIKRETGLLRCASLGRLTREKALKLANAGLCRFHHNLETSRSYFPSICTTHDFDERLATIAAVKEAGIESCVGGILGMGESVEQRIEFAFDLKAVEPDSVPINFLNPRPGTPLAGLAPIAPVEAVRYIAIFRLVMPRSIIRLAAGRREALGASEDMGISAGVNGMLIGDYLTTEGPNVEDDIGRLRRLGFDTSKPS